MMPQFYLDHLHYVTNPWLYPKPADDKNITAADIKAFNNSGITSELATDCIISKAREYSDQKDEARSVAIAVLDACKIPLSYYEGDIQEETEARFPGDLEQVGSDVKDAQAAEMKTAIHYVVEARAGHCSINRKANGVPMGGYAAIQ